MAVSDERYEQDFADGQNANEELQNDILEVTVGEAPEVAFEIERPAEQEAPEDAEAPEKEEVENTEEAEETEETEEPETRPEAENESGSKMKRLLRVMLRDDESETGSLKDMFNDIQISGEWLKKHWTFLLIVFVSMLLFVTNRYQAQQEIIEEARLKQELNDWKFIWLTQFSELTRSTRQSNIEESLKHRGDSTLRLSKEAPFIIKAK